MFRFGQLRWLPSIDDPSPPALQVAPQLKADQSPLRANKPWFRMPFSLEGDWSSDMPLPRENASAVEGGGLASSEQGARLYLSVSSEGFGHSSRAMALARHLPTERVLVGTYGIAYQRLQRHKLPCVEVPQEIKLVGKAGGFDVGKTILENPSRALTFHQTVQQEMEAMRAHRASLVVADGRMAPVVAASRLALPCVVLTNQSAFYPFFARDTALVKLLGLSFEWLMAFWLSSAEEIWIPDFPPPYTVCLPNLSQQARVKKRTRFVGPLVAWRPDELPQVEPLASHRRGRLVVSLGGHAYRRPLFDAVLAVAQQLPDYQWEVFSAFQPEATTLVPDNVVLHAVSEECAPYFKAADLIVTQAGHSTAMEVLTLGKPCVIVPDTNQTEQENNAQRLQALGVAECLTYAQMSRGTLLAVIERALNNPQMREQAAVLAQQAVRLNGAQSAAELLMGYAQRLSLY